MVREWERNRKMRRRESIPPPPPTTTTLPLHLGFDVRGIKRIRDREGEEGELEERESEQEKDHP